MEQKDTRKLHHNCKLYILRTFLLCKGTAVGYLPTSWLFRRNLADPQYVLFLWILYVYHRACLRLEESLLS